MNDSFSGGIHPLTILKFVRKLLFVLLLPLLRSLLNYGIQGTLSTLVTWETALAVALFGYGVLRWARFRVRIDRGVLELHTGLFFRRTVRVPLSKVTCVYVESDPLLTLVNAVKVSIDTNSGEYKNTDFEFYFPRSRVDALCTALHTVTPRNRIYLCTTGQIALMSLSSASALSGLLVAAGIVNKSGKILGDALEKRLVETINVVTALTSKIIPPAATILAAVLVVGSCISFLMTLMKHLSFVVRCNKHGILIEQGWFRHKQSYIRRDAIGVGVISMPPLLHLFRRCSLCIHASGYGVNNGERSILFPVEKARDAEHSMHILGVDLCKGDRLTLRIPRRAMSRALFMPTACLLALMAAVILSAHFLPDWYPIFLPIGIFIGIINLYWIYLRISHTRHGGAELRRGVRVYGYRGMTLTDARFKKGCVDSIIVTEGPFDRAQGLCTLRAVLQGEKAYCARTPNLDKAEVMREIGDRFEV